MIEGLKPFKKYLYTVEERPGYQIGPHAFAIILTEYAKFSRNELVCFLEKQGIDSRNLFSSMPTQCAGFKYLGYKLGQFPNAEYIGERALHIGIHQDLTTKDLDYILSTIAEFLAKKKK